MSLNIEIIKNKLDNKSQIEYYNEINSTHIYAKKIAKNTENSNKIIIAEKQIQGVGTKGRNWYTGEGKNIAITIIKHPKKGIKEIEGLTIKIAQLIKEAIFELYGYTLTIKEPNDLMINNKKICGILTEVHTQAEKIQYLLISFGFNVNEDEFSEETQDVATSLKKEFNKTFEREEIIIKILNKLLII